MSASVRMPQRALVEDVREDGAFLRVTWHDASNRFVVSHWRDNVCVAATQLDPAGAAPVIGVLADGLARAAQAPIPHRVRRWWRRGG